MDRSRRSLAAVLATLAGTASLGARLARAQTPGPATAPGSQAAREAKAPPLPALGSLLRLPEADYFDGTRFRPADVDGQVLLVYWWASFCPFCAIQSPYMDAFWKAGRTRGLKMLALSIDKTPAPAIAYLKKKGYSFPSAWASPAVQAVMPKPKGLPITIVRGRDGRVLQAERGQMFEEDVQEMARWL